MASFQIGRDLEHDEARLLVAFLHTLTGEYREAKWSFRPRSRVMLLGLAGLCLLTFLLLKTTGASGSTAGEDLVESRLRDLKRLDTALNESALKLRFGLLRELRRAHERSSRRGQSDSLAEAQGQQVRGNVQHRSRRRDRGRASGARNDLTFARKEAIAFAGSTGECSAAELGSLLPVAALQLGA